MSGVKYPDGSIEGVVYIPTRRGTGGRSWWQELDQEEKEQDNRRRSARLARRTMQRKIRSGNLRRLLTFTNGGADGGFDSLQRSLRLFERWYREDGRELLGETPIVALAEPGGRFRRFHVHAAVRSGYRLDYNAIRGSWSAFLERHGYHSPTGTHRFHAGDDNGQHSHGFASARTCALYMAGYLAKSLLDDAWQKGQRRFEAHGCEVPTPRVAYGLRLGEAPEVVSDSLGGCALTPFYRPDGTLCGYWFDSGAPPKV